MPGGQPTKMTPETLKILDDAFSSGASDTQACFLAKISPQTLYNYQERFPEYVERKEWLKDNIKFKAKRNVAKEIDKGNINVSTWYLERKAKDEFSERKEITGADGAEVRIDINNKEVISLIGEFEEKLKEKLKDDKENKEAGKSLEA